MNSSLMARGNFLEGTISMKNEKTLANTMVGTDILGEKNIRSRVFSTGMHGCIWGSQRRQEKESSPHFQKVGLYSGIMGKRFLTLGFEKRNDNSAFGVVCIETYSWCCP